MTTEKYIMSRIDDGQTRCLEINERVLNRNFNETIRRFNLKCVPRSHSRLIRHGQDASYLCVIVKWMEIQETTLE